MILGTAGHIDHGKTSLVRALTGVETDRLPEEKRRGITIELGFAPLQCANGTTIGVVDVPGHEAFVRTMLAGASGIDLALLVVAADEGVMPQTREHLAILSLLGVSGAAVALTKCDAVDTEWLALVRQEVRDATVGTPLENAPVIATSCLTGEGLPELRDTIAAAAAALPPRDGGDLFRMPVDRAFTLRGTGTVVTGTVWTGSLRPDETVRILPGDRSARVRGVQVHGAGAGEVGAGSRAALALHGVAVGEVSRGDVIVTDAAWRPTRVLRGEVGLLPGCQLALQPRTTVRFHLGTQEVGARVVTPGGPLTGGELRPARIMLDAPIVARAGDRFVLRVGSPLGTIGGGCVADPLPAGRRVRPWTGALPQPGERLARLLAEAGDAGLELALLPVRLGVGPREAQRLVRSAPAIEIAGRVYAEELIEGAAARLAEAVRSYHELHPLQPGMPLPLARAALAFAPEVADAAIRRAVDGHLLAQSAGGGLCAAGWAPRLTPHQADLCTRLSGVLDAARWEPPSLGELEAAVGPGLAPLLRKMERDGQVVQIEEGRFASRASLDALASTLRAGMSRERCSSPSELRDLLGVSRKYLIPLLEYCDRAGVTERRNGGRVLRGT